MTRFIRRVGGTSPDAAPTAALDGHDSARKHHRQHTHDGDAVVDVSLGDELKRQRVADDLVGASAPVLGVEVDAGDDQGEPKGTERDGVLVLRDLDSRDDERHGKEDRDDGHDEHFIVFPLSRSARAALKWLHYEIRLRANIWAMGGALV